MAEFYPVVAKIISQKGHCSAENKVGQEFLIAQHTPAGLCTYAFAALFPFATVLQLGGSFPWEPAGSDKCTVVCPDPGNPVTFELRRVRNTPK